MVPRYNPLAHHLLPHPCADPTKVPHHPHITTRSSFFRIKDTKLPANYPYRLDLGSQETVNNFVVPFYVFEGRGPPVPKIGVAPGDLYMDTTPGSHALFYLRDHKRHDRSWKIWPAPEIWTQKFDDSALVSYPQFPEDDPRVLWCNEKRGPTWTDTHTVDREWRNFLTEGKDLFYGLERGEKAEIVHRILKRFKDVSVEHLVDESVKQWERDLHQRRHASLSSVGVVKMSVVEKKKRTRTPQYVGTIDIPSPPSGASDASSFRPSDDRPHPPSLPKRPRAHRKQIVETSDSDQEPPLKLSTRASLAMSSRPPAGSRAMEKSKAMDGSNSPVSRRVSLQPPRPVETPNTQASQPSAFPALPFGSVGVASTSYTTRSDGYFSLPIAAVPERRSSTVETGPHRRSSLASTSKKRDHDSAFGDQSEQADNGEPVRFRSKASTEGVPRKKASRRNRAAQQVGIRSGASFGLLAGQTSEHLPFPPAAGDQAPVRILRTPMTGEPSLRPVKVEEYDSTFQSNVPFVGQTTDSSNAEASAPFINHVLPLLELLEEHHAQLKALDEAMGKDGEERAEELRRLVDDQKKRRVKDKELSRDMSEGVDEGEPAVVAVYMTPEEHVEWQNHRAQTAVNPSVEAKPVPNAEEDVVASVEGIPISNDLMDAFAVLSQEILKEMSLMEVPVLVVGPTQEQIDELERMQESLERAQHDLAQWRDSKEAAEKSCKEAEEKLKLVAA